MQRASASRWPSLRGSMGADEMSSTEWRKSTRSNAEYECVEVTVTTG